MPKITSFDEANQVLMRYVPPMRVEAAYTLDRMTRLVDYLGNPQEKFKTIHVAGTSGKTSTCYYLAAMLFAAGNKVGLTVSPHIVNIGERVQINMQPLDEAEFCEDLADFLALVEASGIKPSYFELLVAFAYWSFAKQKVDYAVIEVGLGGLLDGTNVIKRADKICIITDIGLDHTRILGKSVAAIAAQKAGIIRPHNVVFSYEQDDKIMDVIREASEHQQADLHEIVPPSGSKTPRQLPLFQRRNWYLAQAAIRYVADRDGLSVSEEQLYDAANMYIPARMERVTRGSKTIILDGSHNEQKIGALVQSIRKMYPTTPAALLVSFGQNKSSSVQASLKLLRKLGENIIITEFHGGQDEIRKAIKARRMEEFAQLAGFTNITINIDPKTALDVLLKQSESLLIVTGSFYLLNHIRPLIMNKHD